MGINEIIIYIMVFFMAIGALDKCIGNKFGYGQKFEEGIMAMGALALSMVGIVSLAPVLANILRPIVGPVYAALGADNCGWSFYELYQELRQEHEKMNARQEKEYEKMSAGAEEASVKEES